MPLPKPPRLYPSPKPESRLFFPAFKVVPSFVEPSHDRSKPSRVIRSAHHHTSFILCDFALPSLEFVDEGNPAFASRLQLRVAEGVIVYCLHKTPSSPLQSIFYHLLINRTSICLRNLSKLFVTMVKRIFV